ncbi:MAG: hypothetical protein CVT68_08560 [Actinobacteria bacterium HGW-Actinobacteria-8]|nr:MAG: hypothetical protein CVT68_08560 [Actinobacteria bacterium HGW-Actinobacteria-8]
MGGLSVASAAYGQAVANSASLPDAPIAAVALPWALVLGRFDPRVETLAVLAEGDRAQRAQAFVFHDVEGPAAQMVLPTDPERGTDAPPAVACAPLDWLRGTFGTTRPDGRFDALGDVVCLLGAMVVTLRSRGSWPGAFALQPAPSPAPVSSGRS